jgi:hypothetical protein
MKKTMITTIFLSTALAVNAQSDSQWRLTPDNVMELLRAVGVILVLYLIGRFILNFTRQILDYRLKHKMIDKGVPDQIIAQLALAGKKDNRLAALQWAFILAGIGLGLLLIGFFPPLGLHSLMIMCFCISLSFLLYYYFTRSQPL